MAAAASKSSDPALLFMLLLPLSLVCVPLLGFSLRRRRLYFCGPATRRGRVESLGWLFGLSLTSFSLSAASASAAMAAERSQVRLGSEALEEHFGPASATLVETLRRQLRLAQLAQRQPGELAAQIGDCETWLAAACLFARRLARVWMLRVAHDSNAALADWLACWLVASVQSVDCRSPSSGNLVAGCLTNLLTARLK